MNKPQAHIHTVLKSTSESQAH